jgi:hypothetical protein
MLRFSGLPPPGVGGGGWGVGGGEWGERILFISGIKMPVYVCGCIVLQQLQLSPPLQQHTNSIEINAATHAHCHPALEHVSFFPGHVAIQKNRNARARIFKLLRSPRIHSKEPILHGCVAWRAGTTTLFLLGS